MKKLYTLTLVISCLLFSSLSSSAQYAGGTYTAVTAGNWHTASGPGIWQTVEPPQNCVNCLIVLNIEGTVTPNTTVTLSDNATLQIGGTGNTTVLTIGNSGASGFATSNSIILANDGTGNTIQLLTSTFSWVSRVIGAGTVRKGCERRARWKRRR